MADEKNSYHGSVSSTAPRIGITFGGGGAKGFAHIHAIRAFDDLGIKPVQITGASIGSIMGAGMAANMSGEEIEDHSNRAFGQGTEVISRLWQMRPKSLSDIFGKENRLGQVTGLRMLRSFLPDSLPETIEELDIPFSAIASDFYGMSETVLSSGNLFEALAASSAIPGVFQPVKINGRYHVDAAAVNCLPFDHLADDLDITIAVDVAGEPMDENPGRPPTTFDALLGTNMIMLRQMRALRMEQRQPDILIQAPVNDFGVQDFLKVGQILDTTQPVREVLKINLDQMIESKIQGIETQPTKLLVQPSALA